MAAKKPVARSKAVTSRAPQKRASRAPARATKPVAAKAGPAPTKGAAEADVPNAIGLWHHHLDYTSHDMAGIKRFYTQVLGFTRFIEEPKVPYLTMDMGELTRQQFDPHEGFVISRVNGQWDVQSILKLCPMSEEDALLIFSRLIDRKVIELRET